MSEWVSVKNKMPLQGQDVLFVSDMAIGILKGWHDLENKRWFTSDEIYYDNEVTHWMPLPEPPNSMGDVLGKLSKEQ